MIRLNKNPEKDFQILNLTDPQLTAEEWANGHKTGQIFKTTVETLIKRVSPNLITVSGDLSYPGDLESYRRFSDYFDSFGIPWTCCFGNHDNQQGDEAVRAVVAEYAKHPLFVYEECDPALGNANFVILIQMQDKPVEGVILMDTHDREFYLEDDKEKAHWAKLSWRQLAWYESTVKQLRAAGCEESTLITHIPIYAYRQAFQAAFNRELEPKSIRLENCTEPGIWNAGYEDSYGVNHEPISCYPHEDGVFDLVCELGSTKTIVCGHDHTNNWMVNYKGVRFVYALKTGCGCYWEPELNGGTVLAFGDGGVTSVHHEYVSVNL